ncbi:hypothetical protein [Paenibacillus wynnii]|uniref:hypothetical protein n=1 Tax=Paenibacillus wynnii TaxID=268407 RepID=UPI00278D759D|nr:hypothetical protein [Paenibacillus wynnii]MDQ0194715.1 hypothetical protein [Paenibacillus wynnii]
MLNRKIRLLLVLCAAMLGVTGCVGKDQKVQKMISYVEDKYGQSFEVEQLDKGSTFFAELYGGDKLLVHPKGQVKEPFFVFEHSTKHTYSDNYVQASLSNTFTEIHKLKIEQFDSRKRAVKLAFRGTNTPSGAAFLGTSAEDFNRDLSYDADIYVDVVVKMDSSYGISQDAEFLYQLYNYMKSITQRNFIISIAYIKPEKFEEAEEIIRIAHTVNFAWAWLGDGVEQEFSFERKDPVQDASYFVNINR